MRQFFLRDYIKNAVRIFFLGIIVGIVLILICRNKLQTDISIFNEEWILHMQNTVIENKSLFLYVLFKRLKELGFMFLLASTIAGIICIYGYVGFIGSGFGAMVAILCLRYGLKGMGMMMAALFPHVLLYIPAFLYLFHMCYLLCVKLYFPHKDYWKSSGTTKVFLFKNILYICIALVVVIIGVLLESYVNPQIIFSFIKKF